MTLPTKLSAYFQDEIVAGNAYPPEDERMVLLYKAVIQIAIWLDDDAGVSKNDHQETIENININTELGVDDE